MKCLKLLTGDLNKRFGDRLSIDGFIVFRPEHTDIHLYHKFRELRIFLLQRPGFNKLERFRIEADSGYSQRWVSHKAPEIIVFSDRYRLSGFLCIMSDYWELIKRSGRIYEFFSR